MLKQNKTETNCLNSYINNDCYKKEIKYERGKLHIRYLLILSVLFIIGSISLVFGNDNQLAGQLSMASTITSIILSCIAIIMSLLGEKETNNIKNQLIGAIDKLDKTTTDINNNNEIIQKEMSSSLDASIRLQIELQKSLESINEGVKQTNEKVNELFDTGHDKYKGDEKSTKSVNIIEIYNRAKDIFNKDGRFAFDRVIEYRLINKNKIKSKTIDIDESLGYLTKLGYSFGRDGVSLMCGMAMVVLGIDIANEKDNADLLFNKVKESRISDSLNDKDIEKYYDDYKALIKQEIK